MNDDAQNRTTWARVELGGVLAGRDTDPPPVALERSDGQHLFYAGRVHSVAGEPETGKGWLALLLTAQQIAQGAHVLYVDFEDSAPGVVSRLQAMGVADGDVLERFVYVRPDEPFQDRALDDLKTAAQGCHTVVLDGVTEALTLDGLDLHSNIDVTRWLQRLPRPLAQAGRVVVLLDHVVKDREGRGRFAIGAQAKLAGIDMMLTAEVVSAFARGRAGRIKLKVTKDRPGYVRGIADDTRVGDLVMHSQSDGTVTLTLEPPESTTSPTTGAFRPTTLMQRVSEALEAKPGMSSRDVRDIRGKNDALDAALAALIAEGYVEVRADGRAKRHHVIRPFRTDDRAPVPPTRPDRAPGTSSADRAPVPLPLQGGTGTGHTTAPRAQADGAPDADAELARLEGKGLTLHEPSEADGADGEIRGPR